MIQPPATHTMKYSHYGAELSPCGKYRYRLWRLWDANLTRGRVCWIMLNPSTADGDQDDPTIRRCVGLSKSWGFSGIRVVNLFAYRATNPKVIREGLKTGLDVVGPANREKICLVASGANMVIAAWGSHGAISERRWDTIKDLHTFGISLMCVGLTKFGHPKHPLYVPGTVQLIPYNP